MARKGKTTFEPNQAWFDQAMRLPGVERLTDDAADRALAAAKSTAPVDTGDYLAGLHIEHHEAHYRRSTRVVGDDPKTLMIEARTGNLARSVKAAKQ